MPVQYHGKYMYCLIRCAEPQQFSTLGIGERGDAVYTVGAMGLAAVVSDSPKVAYDSSRRNLMAHTLVLEEVMQSHTILPVRFDTVAPSAAAIQEQVLTRRFHELDRRFNEMDSHVEMGIKAFWYEDVIFAEVVAENLPIRRLRDSLVGTQAEKTYYERIRLGELIEQAMWKKREEDSTRIIDRLRPLIHKIEINKVVSDRMVLNTAFLIEREREPDFDQAVQQLDAEMSKRMMFKYVGPVPPYNFVNILIHWDAVED